MFMYIWLQYLITKEFVSSYFFTRSFTNLYICDFVLGNSGLLILLV